MKTMLLTIAALATWTSALAQPAVFSPGQAVNTIGQNVTNLAFALTTKNLRDNAWPTPPMGFNSWYQTGVTAANETNLMWMADYLVSTGLREKGYRYVVCDAGWTLPATNALARNPDGSINVNSNRFPHGMKYWVDYVHSLGLKAGIHTETGTYQDTDGMMASSGHFAQDAATFASWTIDYIKWDVMIRTNDAQQDYRQVMLDYCAAVDATHRPMPIYSACYYSSPITTNADLFPFSQVNAIRWVGDMGTYVMSNAYWQIQKVLPYANAASRGHWLDFDVLTWPSDFGGISYPRARSSMGLYCLLNAQLMIPSEPSDWPLFYILSNEEAIAINQDVAYPPASVISSNAQAWVLAKQLADNSFAVGLWNASTSAVQTITLGWTNLSLPKGPVVVRDIWARTNSINNTTNGVLTASVAAGDLALFKVTAPTPERPLLEWAHGGVSVGMTPSDPGTNGLYVQGAITFGGVQRTNWPGQVFGTNFTFMSTSNSISSGTNFVVDCAGAVYQRIMATNNVTFMHVTNGPGAVSVTVLPNGADRLICVPTNWVLLSTNGLALNGTFWAGTLTNGNRVALLSTVAHGPDPTNVLAALKISQP